MLHVGISPVSRYLVLNNDHDFKTDGVSPAEFWRILGPET